jgi:hypothetical protein
MPKYQIRFCDSKGHGSFCYVDCSQKQAPQKAAEKATEYINNQKGIPTGLFRQPYKPKRIVHVWEWDSEEGEPKKKGYRFKLELMFIAATYNSGRKVRQEWYEPIV